MIGREIFNLNPGDKIAVLGDDERGIALQKADMLMGFFDMLKEAEEDA